MGQNDPFQVKKKEILNKKTKKNKINPPTPTLQWTQLEINCNENTTFEQFDINKHDPFKSERIVSC